MRSTEALHLSNPKTKLTIENIILCTHLDIESNLESIKKARKANRKHKKTLFD